MIYISVQAFVEVGHSIEATMEDFSHKELSSSFSQLEGFDMSSRFSLLSS